MTAIEIVTKRTGMAESEASYYVELAVLRIRNFLKVDEIEFGRYLFPVSDIATLLYQIDASTKNSRGNLGYTSKSFSEGGVSKSESGMTGSDIYATYEASIRDILDNLTNDAGQVRFL